MHENVFLKLKEMDVSNINNELEMIEALGIDSKIDAYGILLEKLQKIKDISILKKILKRISSKVSIYSIYYINELNNILMFAVKKKDLKLIELLIGIIDMNGDINTISILSQYIHKYEENDKIKLYINNISSRLKSKLKKMHNLMLNPPIGFFKEWEI